MDTVIESVNKIKNHNERYLNGMHTLFKENNFVKKPYAYTETETDTDTETKQDIYVG